MAGRLVPGQRGIQVGAGRCDVTLGSRYKPEVGQRVGGAPRIIGRTVDRQSLSKPLSRLAELPTLPPDAEKPIVSLVPPMQREAPLWLVSRTPYEPGRVRQILLSG